MSTPTRRHNLVIRTRRAITADGDRPSEIGVVDGRIVAVEPLGCGLVAERTIELADDEVLLPGLVDTHVHVNEPGRTAWEGFDSATRAAAAGGITTLIDMPLNSLPPTIDAAALSVKRAAAMDRCHIDVGFWGGAVPGNAEQLPALADAGVFGFKCFLADSGVAEFGHLDARQLGSTMTSIAALDSVLLVHAEDTAILARAPSACGRRYRDFLVSRPRAAENAAVDAVIDAARRTGARAHILHLSSADAVAAVAAARAAGVGITVETCPHYLTLVAQDIPDGATEFKCCPPIREAENAERLWAALADGVIDCIVSDHSPCTVELKRLDTGDFGTAWGGIASVQLGLPAIWTRARRRGHSLAEVIGWMATRPARIAGLTEKGSITAGADADLVVFAPDSEFLVVPTQLHHKVPITPYAGQVLSGVVRRTMLRGIDVSGRDPAGRLLAAGPGG